MPLLYCSFTPSRCLVFSPVVSCSARPFLSFHQLRFNGSRFSFSRESAPTLFVILDVLDSLSFRRSLPLLWIFFNPLLNFPPLPCVSFNCVVSARTMFLVPSFHDLIGAPCFFLFSSGVFRAKVYWFPRRLTLAFFSLHKKSR